MKSVLIIISPAPSPTPWSELPTGSEGLLQRAHWLHRGVSKNNKNTCSPSAKYGDNDFCLNNGSCISVSGTDGKLYNKCECVKPFAGKHCKKNIGVQVLIRDNFTSPTVIERIPMFKYEGHDYFIQDNDYL